ncbi:hypothetical protein SeMB42_g04687 [Synchytrium endobioticum]|uniref:CobW/HypB/UreG nucleotide-binding domain-containing protein n=1 Tax=Synchytrium endobioticum TaxID=286115 RepID=A0A507CNM7_9FUNG|nr:hypothetical protein SeLEV6574_g06429 [Synchytrium endobioticum]TPX43549.1 hypothetical protein SeMB42_g04687 [Synchytrium endobioticum]
MSADFQHSTNKDDETADSAKTSGESLDSAKTANATDGCRSPAKTSSGSLQSAKTRDGRRSPAKTSSGSLQSAKTRDGSRSPTKTSSGSLYSAKGSSKSANSVRASRERIPLVTASRESVRLATISGICPPPIKTSSRSLRSLQSTIRSLVSGISSLAGIGSAPQQNLRWKARNWGKRAFTIGFAGPVGVGKTSIIYLICRTLGDIYNVGVVTNDVYTTQNADWLITHDAIPRENLKSLIVGACPHFAIYEDISANLKALEELQAAVGSHLLLIEACGDNMASTFSQALVDYSIYVMDVTRGDEAPTKGGPGITDSDLLIINKTDLISLSGCDMEKFDSSVKMKRGDKSVMKIQSNIIDGVYAGKGVEDVINHIVAVLFESGADVRPPMSSWDDENEEENEDRWGEHEGQEDGQRIISIDDPPHHIRGSAEFSD